eukprot:4789024-Pyramimonas_sp.AAC.1
MRTCEHENIRTQQNDSASLLEFHRIEHVTQIQSVLANIGMSALSQDFCKESGYPLEAWADADSFARWALAEARTLFIASVDSKWRLEYHQNKAKLWSRPVEGDLGFFIRSESEIEVSAKEVFQVLTGHAGPAIINSRILNHNDAPIEVFQWRDRMECVNTKAGYTWPMSDRDFVVCNIFDTKPLEPDRQHPLFVSKSIRHPRCPESDGYVRGLSTFAVQTEKITDERCKLHILHFMHVGGNVPMIFGEQLARASAEE